MSFYTPGKRRKRPAPCAGHNLAWSDQRRATKRLLDELPSQIDLIRQARLASVRPRTWV